MRVLAFLLAFVFVATTSVFAGSQVVTKHFHVKGVCEQCKKRIEGAAYVKGVRYAEWNIEDEDLTVKYDSTKTSPEVILKSVAKSGHDNELFTAEEEHYEKIAKCCKYRSGIKKH